MPFENDILNYRKMQNTDSFYYHSFSNNFWIDFSKLISSANYKYADLRGIVNRSRKLFNLGHTTRSKYDELKHQMLIIIDKLHTAADAGDIGKLMDCLVIMINPEALPVEKMNEFLASQKIGYRYSAEKNKWEIIPDEEVNNMSTAATTKKPKIFISHASKDKEYIISFVNWLESIGLNSDNIFCTSIAEYGIPEGEDIYEFIEEQYKKYDLHVVFMLSKNYYKSAAALNEMGATWILRKRYTTFFLPGFRFKKIEGAVNPVQIGIKMDAGEYELKSRFSELRLRLKEEFHLAESSDVRWEEHRDTCIVQMKAIYEREKEKMCSTKRK